MKIIGNGLALIIVALGAIGLLSNFLVNESIVQYLLWSGFIFSIIILIVLFIRILKEGSAFKERMKEQGKSPVVGIGALLITVPLLVIPAFYKGVPVVMNYITGEDGLIIVTALRKSAGHSSRSCSGKVKLVEYMYFTNDRVCGINKEDWKKINEGDQIMLIGKKSIFGINYKKYKI